jgi:hypothetical protein
MKFTVELKRIDDGYVVGRLIDTESGEGVFYEVTLRSDSTRASQTQVLKNLVGHLNWYIDLSEGWTK